MQTMMQNAKQINNFENLPLDMTGIHLFFTGIKGTGMAALVEICLERGATIEGSDVDDVFYTDALLARYGIKAKLFNKKNITQNIDLLFHSSAYDPDSHEELLQAKALGIPIMEYTIALGLISKASFSVAVSGVHGKTSTTSIIGTMLKDLPLLSQVLVGSQVPSLGDSCTMNKGSEYFVAETCEYKKHFLHFHPNIILMTSVEEDHQDFFPTYEDMRDAFVEFAYLLPKGGRLIYCSDDKGCQDVVSIVQKQRSDIRYVSYGAKPDKTGAIVHYSIHLKNDSRNKVNKNIQSQNLSSSGQSFILERQSIQNNRDKNSVSDTSIFPKTFSHLFSLPVPGFHTILNTAAGIAVCIELLEKENIKRKHNQLNNFEEQNEQDQNIKRKHNQLNNHNELEIGNWKTNLDSMAASLLKFRGAKRRGEIIAHFEKGRGILHDTFVLDDYAHHPTAIKTTLQGFKDFYPDHKIIVSFMSHTYSRTQALIDEFASSFSAADSVFLHKIYSSARENKEKYLGNTSGEILFEKTKTHHSNVHYFDEFMDAVDPIISLIDTKPSVFITMGAGDNWKLGKAIVEKLIKRSEL